VLLLAIPSPASFFYIFPFAVMLRSLLYRS
jgi:hypothetical protein